MTKNGLILVLVLLLSACASWITDILDFGSLEVSTVTRSGAPVSGSELVLYNDVQVMGVGFTNSDGIHSFDIVPDQPYGVHNEPPDGHMRPEDVVGGPSTAYVQSIILKEGDEQSVSFIFVKVGSGRIDVSVTDPSGMPIENTKVVLYGPEGTLSEKITESSGVVSFDPVSFGNRAIRVVPPRSYLDSDAGFFFQHGLLIDEDWTEEVSFVLEKCLGTVRGSVQDISGAPVMEHTVRLYSSTATLDLKDTGVDGEAVFDSIPCGNRGLSLVETPGWSFEEGRGLSFHDGISITDQSDQVFSFTVEPCRGTVRGSVQDVSGSPVTEHPLRLYSSTATLDLKDTGVDGEVVFDSIPCGDFGIALVQRPGWIFEEGLGLSFLDGISVINQSNQRFLFSVESCSGEIGVRVEGQNSDPVSGALLELYTKNRNWDQDVTGADGALTFTNACGMEVGVKVTPPTGYTVQQGRGLSFFDGLNPEPGGRIEVVFRLQSS